MLTIKEGKPVEFARLESLLTEASATL